MYGIPGQECGLHSGVIGRRFKETAGYHLDAQPAYIEPYVDAVTPTLDPGAANADGSPGPRLKRERVELDL